MSTKYKISAEMKADILKRIKEGGVSVQQAATDHGVGESTIYKWLGNGIQTVPSWGEFNRVNRQNKELVTMIGELTIRLSGTQKKS